MLNRLPRLGWRKGLPATSLAGSRLLCPMPHGRLHASQRVLNLETIGDLTGVEFVPAQPTGQIHPELELPQPDLEQLLAVRTGQIDPHASMIFEQVAFSG
ncbi:hypothetical protein [Microvirga sp. Mcv34]|uniref:hypothetical protein n=1 Tax=Microvirga sp. Mcv34 TaxID=2926016 RepID=UPI0021C849D1|nr:hypothetical protein [Microvirga sp. Mcv34]